MCVPVNRLEAVVQSTAFLFQLKSPEGVGFKDTFYLKFENKAKGFK